MSKDLAPVKNRSEILFIYDVIDANPNGDPNDENRPRMDLESGRAKVSDVRLKRTIRDYLHDEMGEEIFCREIEKDDGTIEEGKDRAEDFFRKVEQAKQENAKRVTAKRDAIEKIVIESCIDVRLFGATIPVGGSDGKKDSKGSSITLTGPVQFAMGGTLHRVEPQFVKGTGAFASGQGAQQKTFREEYMLPYALIAFYGIVNQRAAKTTKLSAEDVEKLYRGIWNGTKELITRSKIGQRPLLLVAVEYKPEHSDAYIGRLDRFLGITVQDGKQLRDEAIRDASDVRLNLSNLASVLASRRDKISRIRFVHDDRLGLVNGFTRVDGKYGFNGMLAERFPELESVQFAERPVATSSVLE